MTKLIYYFFIQIGNIPAASERPGYENQVAHQHDGHQILQEVTWGFAPITGEILLIELTDLVACSEIVFQVAMQSSNAQPLLTSHMHT